MKKINLILFSLLAIAGNLFSQKTDIELIFGYQKHDKRFFGISDENDAKQGNWGTGYLGFKVNRRVLLMDKFEIRLGFGLAQETNTCLTPFNHCFDRPNQPCTAVLTWIQSYIIDMAIFSFTPKFNLSHSFSIKTNITPQWYFYKEARAPEKTSDFMFGLYSIEFSPEIEYNAERLNIAFGFRVYQMKTIDKVYVYGNKFLTKNPGYLDRNFDTYNPVKIILTVGYDIGK